MVVVVVIRVTVFVNVMDAILVLVDVSVNMDAVDVVVITTVMVEVIDAVGSMQVNVVFDV